MKIMLNRKSFGLLILSIPVIIIVAFIWVGQLPFLADDYYLLLNAGLHPFPLMRSWVENGPAMWRPLAILSLWLQKTIFGLVPGWYYTFNFILHICNGILLYQIVCNVGKKLFSVEDRIIAGVVTFAFFLSIQAMTNVLWISGRTDILCATFGFSAIAIASSDKKLTGYRYAGIAALLILALLTKETGLIFIYFVAILAIFSKQSAGRVLSIQLFSLVVLVAAYFLCRCVIFGKPGHEDGSALTIFMPTYWLQGGLAMFMPLDLQEIRYSIFYLNPVVITFAVLSALFSIVVINSLYKNFRKEKIYTLAILALISMASLSMYYRNFPILRVMYIHLLPVTLFLYYVLAQVNRKYIRLASVLLVCLAAVGSVPEYINVARQAKLSTSMHEYFMQHEMESEAVLMPALTRISHRYVDFALNYSIPYWKTGTIQRGGSKLYALPGYETFSLAPGYLNYSSDWVDSVTCVLQIENRVDGFVVTSANDMQPKGMTIEYRNFIPPSNRLARECIVHVAAEMRRKVFFMRISQDGNIVLNGDKN